jgi:hypothetical protein
MADGDRIIIGKDDNTASNPGNETSLIRNEATARTVFVARNVNLGDGIHGEASDGSGVRGMSSGGLGVSGRSDTSVGVSGSSTFGTGVDGNSFTGPGTFGGSDSGTGVVGTSTSGTGVVGTSTSGNGMRGYTSSKFAAVMGIGPYAGVRGASYNILGVGVRGISTFGAGVYGRCSNPSTSHAQLVGGYFDGGIRIVNGNKPFTIDHPLDPQNKYLSHNAVESPEMKNVYDGDVQLDEDGAAWVELPEWFEALNGDFRYQLTAVGGSAPNLHVAEEVSENRFKIAGGEEGMKVCWQLTGSRKDPWAAANPFVVEEDKPEEDRGRYLDPSLYDAPEEQRVMVGPVEDEAVEEEQRPPEPLGIDPDRLEEEHRRQIDELRRLEEEHRREMEELRRRLEERQEEAPPEST